MSLVFYDAAGRTVRSLLDEALAPGLHNLTWDERSNQGTLIPFAQISAQGVQTPFQEAKLQLLVRPHVTADGSVLIT